MILIVLHALAFVLCGLVGTGAMRALLPDVLLVALAEAVALTVLLGALMWRRRYIPCLARTRPPRGRRP